MYIETFVARVECFLFLIIKIRHETRSKHSIGQILICIDKAQSR